MLTTIVLAVAFAAAACAATVLFGLLRRARRQLATARYEAATDPLTLLANRRAFTTSLLTALAQGQPVAVALVDVDGLKQLNDRYGHQSGDHILVTVADHLRRLPPPAAVAARLSGDEFALLITADLDTAYTTACRAWHAVAAAPVVIAGTPQQVQVSIGLAGWRPGILPSQLLHHADTAMYHAKATATGVYAHRPGLPEKPVTARPAHRQRDLPRPRPLHTPQHGS